MGTATSYFIFKKTVQNSLSRMQMEEIFPVLFTQAA